MNPGDVCLIGPGYHGYPPSWVRGEDPQRFHEATLAVVLEVIPPRGDEPRTFLRVFTPLGEVSIYSGFVMGV